MIDYSMFYANATVIYYVTDNNFVHYFISLVNWLFELAVESTWDYDHT